MSLPFSKVPFKEKTLLGKIAYVSSMFTAIGGAVIFVWQSYAWASDRVNNHISEMIRTQAFEAVEADVDNKFIEMHRNIISLSLTQQEGVYNIELRLIENEINDIVRHRQEDGNLSLEDEAKLRALYDDRRRIQNALNQIRDAQQEFPNFIE
jgi:hypothetical protein